MIIHVQFGFNLVSSFWEKLLQVFQCGPLLKFAEVKIFSPYIVSFVETVIANMASESFEISTNQKELLV